MTDGIRKTRFLDILKETALCAVIVLALLEMDRCLENLYPYTWFGTGKRIIDLWMAFEMRTHAILQWAILGAFAIWAAFRMIKRKKTDFGALFPIGAVYLTILVISYAIDRNVWRWINTAKYPVVMLLFVTMMCSTLRGAKRMVRVAADLYIFLLAVNLLYIFFPQLYDLIGWAQDSFIGQYNLTGFPMAVGMMFVIFDAHLNGRKARLWIYAVLFFVNLYLIWCATNLIMGGVFALYLVFPFVRKAAEKWNLWIFTGFTVLMFSALMWFLRPVMQLKPFEWFATTVLKQDVTLSQRQLLWEEVIRLVYKKPLFGHGLGNTPYIWQDPRWTREYLMHTHNCFLQTLYEGGLVYLAAVFVLFGFAAHVLKKSKDRKAVGITVISFFAIMIMQEANIEAWFVWYPVCLVLQTGILICRRSDEA